MFKIACLVLLLIMEFPFVAKFIKARKDFDIIKQTAIINHYAYNFIYRYLLFIKSIVYDRIKLCTDAKNVKQNIKTKWNIVIAETIPLIILRILRLQVNKNT